MRLEPKPDAGDLGEADFPGGVLRGEIAPRVLYELLFDGISYVATGGIPLEATQTSCN